MKALMTLGLMMGLTFAMADDKKEAAKYDAEKALGKWKLTEGKIAGKAIGDEQKKGFYIIEKDKFHIQGEDGKDVWVMEYTLNAKASPAEVDMTITVAPFDEAKKMKGLGIVELDGDTFKLCYDPSGKERPKKFEGDSVHTFTLKRVKEDKKPEKKEEEKKPAIKK